MKYLYHTKKEIKALQQAFREGKKIQAKNPIFGWGWANVKCPKWYNDVKYRVKPCKKKSK